MQIPKELQESDLGLLSLRKTYNHGHITTMIGITIITTYNDRDYNEWREHWEQRGYHDYWDHRKHLEYHGHYA